MFFFTGSKEEGLDSDDLDDDDDDDDDDGDDEDVDDDTEEVEGSSSHAEMNGTEALDGLKTYMDQMDQELMSTNIGQSFNLTVNYCCNHTLLLRCVIVLIKDVLSKYQSGLCQYLGTSHSIQSHVENTNKCHLLQHITFHTIYFCRQVTQTEKECGQSSHISCVYIMLA